MPKFQNYMYTEVTVNLQVAFRKKIVPVPLVFIETSENYNSLKGKWHNEIWKMTIVCDYCENGIRHHMILGSDLGKLSSTLLCLKLDGEQHREMGFIIIYDQKMQISEFVVHLTQSNINCCKLQLAQIAHCYLHILTQIGWSAWSLHLRWLQST